MFKNKGLKAILKQRNSPYHVEECTTFDERIRDMIHLVGQNGIEHARINLDFRDLYPEIQRVNYAPSINPPISRLTRPDENNNGIIIIDHVNLLR